MPKMTLAGHPLHPQLVGFPIGLLPFSCVMDTMYAITGNKAYGKAATYAMIGAAGSAVAAGAAGALDYFAIEKHTPEKKLGNTHALINLGVLALTGVALSRRRNGLPKSRLAAVLLGLAANTGLIVSQWYGGHLVYARGMRVQGKGDLEGVPEYKPSWDKALEDKLDAVSQKMPGVGPQEKIAG